MSDPVVVFRSLVPREGMRGWFRHLSAAWGDPNTSRLWPKDVEALVCEHGPARPVVYDRHAASSRIYFLAPPNTRKSS